MIGFWERDYDVLVCTTIVESGLDIPNANTLILERADLLGLSQLHQLRGRVGRGSERAYAYFLYPVERPLTETAHDRLATIAQNSDLGAGIAIAMKDLEIRGAGNLLGGEQSGHIAAVGFDLYVRLVGEAVADFKGESSQELAEVRIDLPVDAHIPHEYIDGERLRLAAYRAMAEATTVVDVEAVRDELADRYGPLPEPVSNLLEVANIARRVAAIRDCRGRSPGQSDPAFTRDPAGIASLAAAAAFPEKHCQGPNCDDHGSTADRCTGTVGGAATARRPTFALGRCTRARGVACRSTLTVIVSAAERRRAW